MTDEKPTLLPCPFCGKPPHMMVNTAVDCGYVVQCVSTDCIMRSHYFHLDAWERRAQPPDLATKWHDRTRGGHEFEIFAEKKGDLYGLCHFNGGLVQTAWTRKGTSTVKKEFDLIPRSKHSELITETRKAVGDCHPESRMHALLNKLITALEQEGQ